MKVVKLKDQEGAMKIGNCISCGKGSKDDEGMIAVMFSEERSYGVITCLCSDCRKKLKKML